MIRLARIVINGRPYACDEGRIDYSEIVAAVCGDPERVLSVTCKWDGGARCLAPGEDIAVADGMIVSACDTGAA